MKNLDRIAAIVAKILEVFHWVGTGLMAAATISAIAVPQWVGYFIGIDAKECCGANLAVYGFEVNAPVVDGSIDMTTLFFFGIGAVIILALMAMVFHNMHFIFKKSESESPFHKDNIRRLKQIGIFSIAVPVVSIVMSIIVRLVAGPELDAEFSINMGGIFLGIVVLCLTRYFVRGAELEKDVEGLL